MQQLITFLLFKIKNNGQQQKCSGIKDLQKYVTIFFYTCRGYQDSDFIKKKLQTRVGPRTEPCGTPQVIGSEGERSGGIETADVRDDR